MNIQPCPGPAPLFAQAGGVWPRVHLDGERTERRQVDGTCLRAPAGTAPAPPGPPGLGGRSGGVGGTGAGGDGRQPRLVEADLPAEAPIGARGAVREPRRPRCGRRREPGGAGRGGAARLRRPPGEDRGQEHQGQTRQGLQLGTLQGEEESAGDAGREPQPLRRR